MASSRPNFTVYILFGSAVLFSACTSPKTSGQVYSQTVPVIPTSVSSGFGTLSDVSPTPSSLPTPAIDSELILFLKDHALKSGVENPALSPASFGWKLPAKGSEENTVIEIGGSGFAVQGVHEGTFDLVRSSLISEGYAIDTFNTTYTGGSGVLSLKKGNVYCQFMVSGKFVNSANEISESFTLSCGHPVQ